MTSITNWSRVANQVGGTQHIGGNFINNVYFKHTPTFAESDLTSGPSEDPHIRDEDILKSFAFAQMQDRRGNIDQPHEGTCQWIAHMPQYLKWLSDSRGLLWIKGHPGSGKSTLMSYLYDSLTAKEDGDSKILNFFCNARGTDLQHSASGLFRSLLNQLYSQVESSRLIIKQSFTLKHKSHGYDLSLWSWQESEVRDLFTRAILSTDPHTHLMLFIDALDELGESTSREMARHFHMINDKIDKTSQRVKFCISSRHYPIATVIPGIEVWMEKHNSHDIEKFVRDSLNPSLPEGSGKDVEEGQLLLKNLLDRARGIFQWARLVIPMIEKMLLDGEPLTEVHLRMKQIPTKLGEVYEHIIHNVISPRSLQQTFLLFQWILLAPRTLTLRELRYALICSSSIELPNPSLEDSTTGFITSDSRMSLRLKALSGGLLQTVPSTDGPQNLARAAEEREDIVQVVHQSVSDYMFDSGLGLLMSMQTKGQSPATGPTPTESEQLARYCHLSLHRCCLNYIAQFANDGDLLYHEVISQPLEVCRKRPLLKHATISLFVHAAKAGGFPAHEVAVEVRKLQQVLEVWKLVQRCQILGLPPSRVPAASSLLHVAAIWDLADVAENLIVGGYDVHRKASAMTPLHLAAREGSIKTAKVLYRLGANLNEYAHDGLTPLRFAITGCHWDMVDFLSQESMALEDASPEIIAQLFKDTIKAGNAKFVQKLLESGYRPANEIKINGIACTLVEIAVAKRNVEAVSILTAAGMSVDTLATTGRCLQLAVFRQMLHPVESLIKDQKDNLEFMRGLDTSLHIAAQLGNLSILDTLLKAGADINSIRKGRCLIDYAICSCNIAVVKRVLAAGADPMVTRFIFRKPELAPKGFSQRRTPYRELIYDFETLLWQGAIQHEWDGESTERDRILAIVDLVRGAHQNRSTVAPFDDPEIFFYDNTTYYGVEARDEIAFERFLGSYADNSAMIE